MIALRLLPCEFLGYILAYFRKLARQHLASTAGAKETRAVTPCESMTNALYENGESSIDLAI
jgi:hypothetical protein